MVALTVSSAFDHWQSIMATHRAVEHVSEIHRVLHESSLVDEFQLLSCSMVYHDRLSGLICRAQNQPPGYKKGMAKCFWNCCTFQQISHPVHMCSWYISNFTRIWWSLPCWIIQWWRDPFICDTVHIRSYNVKSHWKVQGRNSTPE